jgi:hypothetical protein
MSADTSPPRSSALIFEQPKPLAVSLLDQINGTAFRTSAPIKSVAPLDSQSAQKNAATLDSQWKTTKPFDSGAKAEKLQVVKSKGKEDAYTVKADAQNSFRVRVSDAGFMVVLT